MSSRPALLRTVLLACLAFVMLLASACTIGSSDGGSGGDSGGAPETTQAAPAPTLTLDPPDGAADVNPLAPVSVTASNGTITAVRMTNADGVVVDGVVTPDGSTWKPATTLGYGKQYSLEIDTEATDGAAHEQTSTFTTVEPDNYTLPSFVTSGGNLLTDGGTFGVGIVAVVHFDEPIGDRAAAERTLSVQTTPAVTGSWYWADDQNVHWRPENYYTPGTAVTISAKVYGVEVGEGLFGQEDVTTSFTIGDSHVSVADDDTKQVEVYENGTLVRTMPTSMGMGGSETVGGQTLTFWTQPGVYTVLDKANPVIMDSSTYGLPVNSRLGYKESINYATRISNDGIYLHELEDTVWAQGNTNVSHGCLNLSRANASWFYDFSVPGDVVEVRDTGGAPLQQWQNGDWSVPWSEWLAGSALA
ncbi:L,D-transpeptidase [Rhodococcus sp. BP-149]|jgi:lipoprotein-anchoring transpeptidase ErfK/SrfK|uniref:L,D-transpeptidase n=1 Tax=unclassified Rhodococcus (in: high G+C Gram-positive bacteria) TaxID=192944 RepID=UPI00047F0C4C|nr:MULTISPECIES: Ig-like domain-containing protein [unclassified Rhodococcus (in: high G+C Gram-positive bacteria)]MBY6681075.1 L,D-transpeptidase [Rhodococcus sp. BP-316]MBY6684438.1 L,D-transpeptidase [Rhodococcus sp. BP-288]MBY6692901.1 L,D-transpeptidase [Rhodococcus sp. BP-188]MBY6697098.1 L,D-transpeptidase [Rhodococcus sp. BP-285]MBY6701775.1 L,D-transpeptidase [Rhodococcus sp. BP-283]